VIGAASHDYVQNLKRMVTDALKQKRLTPLQAFRRLLSVGQSALDLPSWRRLPEIASLDRFQDGDLELLWKNLTDSRNNPNGARGGSSIGGVYCYEQDFLAAFGASTVNFSSLADGIAALRAAVNEGGRDAAGRIYDDLDQARRGYVSHEDFIKAMRRLGTGLTLSELEACAQAVDVQGEGMIKRVCFLDFFNGKEYGAGEVFVPDRLELQLSTLRSVIRRSLGSPEDALARFDPRRKGGLNPENFSKAIQTALSMAGLHLAHPVELERLFSSIVGAGGRGLTGTGPKWMPGALFMSTFSNSTPTSSKSYDQASHFIQRKNTKQTKPLSKGPWVEQVVPSEPSEQLTEDEALDRLAGIMMKNQRMFFSSVIAQSEGKRPDNAPLRRDDPRSQFAVKWFPQAFVEVVLSTITYILFLVTYFSIFSNIFFYF